MGNKITILNGEGKNYLELISEDMFAFFRKLGITGDDNPLVIVGGMPVPRFCAAEKNNIPFNMVHLTMQAYSYWCQVVFQLSHELTHYMIYSHCKDESNYASWIEETICEAMSLYFLAWYRDNWEELSLYKYNAVYDKKVGEYLEDELRKEGTERLSRCSSYQELLEIDKPFIVIINSRDINSVACRQEYNRLTAKYDVPILTMDVTRMEEPQIVSLLKEALYEFKISEVRIEVPKWLAMLSNNHWLKQTLDNSLKESLQSIKKFKDVERIGDTISEYDFVDKAYLTGIDTTTSSATLKIEERSGLYNEILEEIIGDKGFDQATFLTFIQELVDIKNEYEGFSSAIRMVKQTGYGYAIPKLDEIELSEPELIKQGPRFGIKLVSKAGTTYMIKVDIESTFEPIIGSKEQAEAFIDYLNSNGDDKQAIFNCDVFGRKLGDLIEEGMYFKLNAIPENASMRIHDILSKIVNKGKSNVIAIVL